MRFSSSHFCLKLKWTYTLLCIGFVFLCRGTLFDIACVVFFSLAFSFFSVSQIITDKYFHYCSINFERVERLVPHSFEGTQTECKSVNNFSMGSFFFSWGFERFRLEAPEDRGLAWATSLALTFRSVSVMMHRFVWAYIFRNGGQTMQYPVGNVCSIVAF